MPRMRAAYDNDPRIPIKARDLRVCIWNVRSLNVVVRINANITTVQEVERWMGQVRRRVAPCDIF